MTVFRTWGSATLLCITLWGLTGCESVQRTSSLQSADLMQLVRSGWSEKNDVVRDGSVNDLYNEAHLIPLHVVRLSETKALLITKSVPVEASHASTATIGAYWFQREGDSWRLEHRMDDVDNVGSNGDIVDSRILNTPDGHSMLVVTSAWVGKGQDNEYESIYRLSEQDLKLVLPLQTGQSDDGGNDTCSQLLDGLAVSPRMIGLRDNVHFPSRCVDIRGQWHFAHVDSSESANSSTMLPDVVVDYGGRQVNIKPLDQSTAGSAQRGQYLAQVAPQSGHVVYRYHPEAGRYEVHEGQALSDRLRLN